MAALDDLERVEVRTRAEWRRWLEARHAQAESIWLVTWKKGRGPYVPYDDIVEEALCFGWIDSTARRLDDDRSMLLLAPRRPGSLWSKANKNRVARLEAHGLIAPAGRSKIEAAKRSGVWTALDGVEALAVPPDLAVALAEVPDADRAFRAFPPSSRRAILAWIAAAKRPETRVKRIAETVAEAAQGRRANFPLDRSRT